MASYGRERISFILDVFDLLQTNDCRTSAYLHYREMTLQFTYCRPCEVSSEQKLSAPPLETQLNETTIHAQRYLHRINRLNF